MLEVRDEKAFTVFELVIGLCILAIIFPIFIRICKISNLYTNEIVAKNSAHMEMENALEYIGDEINRANYIVEIKGLEASNLGFVLKTIKDKKRAYITYEFNKKTREIRRQADLDEIESPFHFNNLKGDNIVLRNVKSIEGSNFNEKLGLVTLVIEGEIDKKTIRKTRVIKVEKGLKDDEEF